MAVNFKFSLNIKHIFDYIAFFARMIKPIETMY